MVYLRRPSVQVLLLCLLTVAAYAGVGQAGFVWDDGALVVGNHLTGNLLNVPAFFTQDLWSSTSAPVGSGYYRPLFLVSLALDRAFFGLDPMEHHIHGLLWHLAAVVLLHRLLLRFVEPISALAGTTVFALHPIQSEAVIWVSARNDPMAAALLIGALGILIEERLSIGKYIVAALLALGAVLAKESALLAPLLLILLDLARVGQGHRRLGLARHAVLWGAVIAHLALRSLAGVSGAALPPPIGWELLRVRAPAVVATYAGLLAWPWPLSGGRDLESLVPKGMIMGLGLVAACSLVAVLVASPRRRRLALVGLGWAAVTFAPSIIALADKGLLGERYLYLPMAGLAMALAAILPDRPLVLGAVGAWCVPWILLLHLKMPDWKDDVTLWSATWRDTPSTYVETGLGHALLMGGRPREAWVFLTRSLVGSPPQMDACSAAVAAALAGGHLDLALATSTMGAERGCGDARFRGIQASVLAMSGRWDEAVEIASRTPDDPLARADLVLAAWGVVNGDCGRYQDLPPTRGESMGDQVARILQVGGHPELATALLAKQVCVP